MSRSVNWKCVVNHNSITLWFCAALFSKGQGRKQEISKSKNKSLRHPPLVVFLHAAARARTIHIAGHGRKLANEDWLGHVRVVRPRDREGGRRPVTPLPGVRVHLHEVDRAAGEPARLHQTLIAVVVAAAAAPFIGDGPL